jgi:hypothetical protein
MALDDRLPVIVAGGQSIARAGAVSALDMAERAAEAALADAGGLRAKVDRVSVVAGDLPPACFAGRSLRCVPTACTHAAHPICAPLSALQMPYVW